MLTLKNWWRWISGGYSPNRLELPSGDNAVRLLTEPTATPARSQRKYAGYCVEYYTYNHGYYAMYKGRYLKIQFRTSIVVLEGDILYAERLGTAEKAWHLVDQHIEQRTKATVKILTRND